MAEAPICVLLSTDNELNELKQNFDQKFKDFSKLMGDDCAVFSAVSNLIKDASNVAGQWEKDLKAAVKKVTDKASEIFNQLKNFAGGMLQAGIDAIKSALSTLNNAFDSITGAVGDMMNALKEALQGVKMATCDLIADAVKSIPAEIVAVSAAAAIVKGYNFAKDLNGKNIVGKFDVDNITTNIMKNMNIDSMKNSVINSGNSAFSTALPDLSRYSCVLS